MAPLDEDALERRLRILEDTDREAAMNRATLEARLVKVENLAQRAVDQIEELKRALSGDPALGSRGKFGEIVDKIDVIGRKTDEGFANIKKAAEEREQRTNAIRNTMIGGGITLAGGIIIVLIQFILALHGNGH